MVEVLVLALFLNKFTLKITIAITVAVKSYQHYYSSRVFTSARGQVARHTVQWTSYLVYKFYLQLHKKLCS